MQRKKDIIKNSKGDRNLKINKCLLIKIFFFILFFYFRELYFTLFFRSKLIILKSEKNKFF